MKNEQPSSQEYLPTSEFYSQVINSLQDYAIFTLDNSLTINSWNSGASAIFQYEATEAIGEGFELIFTGVDREDGIPQKEIDSVLTDGRALDNRWHVRKDGSIFYAYGLVFPIVGADEKRLGFVKILKDLTEQKNLQDTADKYLQDLEDLNTHKENVLAILSHDLRSPLAALIGMAQQLRMDFDTASPSDNKEMLSLILQSAQDELKMLDHLVEWARIKYASEAFTPALVSLFDCVEKVISFLKDLAAVNEVTLYNKVDENAMVFADRKMVHSILHNLVSNALHHTPRGGKIVIASTMDADEVTIEVKDSGSGMPEEILEKLFTPQLTSLLKSRNQKKGAGIGLLLVKGFLDKNNGKIHVQSEEGKGSSFFFSLPVHEPEPGTEGSATLEFSE